MVTLPFTGWVNTVTPGRGATEVGADDPSGFGGHHFGGVHLLHGRQLAGRRLEGTPAGEDVVVSPEGDDRRVGVAHVGVREGRQRRRGRRGRRRGARGGGYLGADRQDRGGRVPGAAVGRTDRARWRW